MDLLNVNSYGLFTSCPVAIEVECRKTGSETEISRLTRVLFYIIVFKKQSEIVDYNLQ